MKNEKSIKEVRAEFATMRKEISALFNSFGAVEKECEYEVTWALELLDIGKMVFTMFTRIGKGDTFALYACPDLYGKAAKFTVARLVERFGYENVNKHSGKWNIHEYSGEAVVKELERRLRSLGMVPTVGIFYPSPDWVELKTQKAATFALCADCGQWWTGEGFKAEAKAHAVECTGHKIRWCGECPEGETPLNIPVAALLYTKSGVGLVDCLKMVRCRGVVESCGYRAWVHKSHIDGSDWSVTMRGGFVVKNHSTRKAAEVAGIARIKLAQAQFSPAQMPEVLELQAAKMRNAWANGEGTLDKPVEEIAPLSQWNPSRYTQKKVAGATLAALILVATAAPVRAQFQDPTKAPGQDYYRQDTICVPSIAPDSADAMNAYMDTQVWQLLSYGRSGGGYVTTVQADGHWQGAHRIDGGYDGKGHPRSINCIVTVTAYGNCMVVRWDNYYMDTFGGPPVARTVKVGKVVDLVAKDQERALYRLRP